MYDLVKPQILAPGIIIYDNVINNSKKIIDLALKSNEWQKSEIYSKDKNGNSIKVVEKNARNCKNLSIYHNYYDPVEWFEIYQTFWRYADNYCRLYNTTFDGMEILQIVHYENDNNFYHLHCDNGKLKNRKLSAVLYLNDIEKGGETYFNNFDITVTPKSGRLLLFPSNYPYTHEAKSPRNGEKFVIVTWFTDSFDQNDNM